MKLRNLPRLGQRIEVVLRVPPPSREPVTGQVCQGLRVKRQLKTMTEPVDEFAVLEALGSAQIVIQVANHQVAKSDHRKKVQ